MQSPVHRRSFPVMEGAFDEQMSHSQSLWMNENSFHETLFYLAEEKVFSLRIKVSKKVQKMLLAIIFAIGLGIFLYPTMSNLYAEYFQNQVIDVYQDKLDQMTKEEKSKQLMAMMEYNASLSQKNGEYTDPFAGIFDSESASSGENDSASVTQSSGSSEAIIYDALSEAIGESLGHIEIPKIDIDIPIYMGTSEKVLQDGIGLLEGSSLPIGGAGTHATLTGHNGLPSAKLFTDLHKVEEGDIFYLHSLSGTLAYKVDTIQTVLPDETESLKIIEGEDLVTLITCTPYMVNTHRLLVTGHRIPYEEKQEVVEEKKENIPTEIKTEVYDYWIYGIVGAVLVLFIFLYVWKRKKEGDQREQ